MGVRSVAPTPTALSYHRYLGRTDGSADGSFTPRYEWGWCRCVREVQTTLALFTNAPWAPTGYGAQVKLFAPHLAEHYDLAISAFYGLEGSRLNWEGIQVFPGLGGEFGNHSLTEHAKRWFGGDERGGIVLTLLDVWVLNNQMMSQLNAACWVPVDHDPCPPAVKEFFTQSGAIPIAMSEFGQEQLEEFDPLYVPHGVDLDEFKPYDKAEVRDKVGIDQEAFICGVVAANKGRPSRKCFQQICEGFRYFRERHENAQLYLHTTVSPGYAEGEDIMALIASLELPEGSVMIADQYRQALDPLSSRLMAQVYSTFDVLLNPSMGEGFGIPILEAQACGVPVIVTDFSAMKEVCGVGWKVGSRPHWTGQRSWQAVPLVEDIVGALEECYAFSDTERAAVAKRARVHAEQYGVERVRDVFFLPALEEVQARIGDRPKVKAAA